MLKLQVLTGSTRQGRNADPILKWLLPQLKERTEFEVELLDLRDWALPLFQETIASLGDLRNPAYSDPLVKKWNQKIKEGDAFLLVTPEYNHSVPAVLKNAIDSVFFSFGFRHKPVAFVGYSTGVGAGVRAVEHLNQIMLEAEAVPVRTQTLVPNVLSAFDAEGKPTSPMLPITLAVMLEDLAWLGNVMQRGRAEGEPLPPSLRMRAAMTKK